MTLTVRVTPGTVVTGVGSGSHRRYGQPRMALSPSTLLGCDGDFLFRGWTVATEWVLHLVTDRLESRLPLAEAVAEAVRGGVDAVQVREKGRPAAEVLEAALTMVALGSCLVLVNDRVDVTLASGAAGVHLPARGLPLEAARRLLPAPDGWLVGVSVHSLEEAQAAAAGGADYVTFGHVLPTGSKPGLPPRGVQELARVVREVPIPVLAIGGIDASNVADVLSTGCAGVAVIRSVLQSEDPCRAVAELRAAGARARGRPRHPLVRGGGRSRGL